MDENGETPAASPLSGELNTAFKEEKKYVNHRLLPVLSILTALAIPPSLLCENRYLQHNLVSDLPGLADHLDPKLVNPWGLAVSSTSPSGS